MSSLVLSGRTGTPDNIITEVSHCAVPSDVHLIFFSFQLYKNPNVFVPKMPSLGLLLEEPIFASYNSRMGTINQNHKPDSPDYRPPVDFEPFKTQIDNFKDQFIYKNMREIEDRDGLCVSRPFCSN